VGDVGWNTWEEVNRMTSPTPANPVNFGWPCYEGAGPMSSYDSANLTICEDLYADTVRPATSPYYAYNHSASVVSGDGCPTNQGSVISAISVYPGGSYPGIYNGALFFGDHSRNCIWAMLPGGNGLPSASNLRAFVVAGEVGGGPPTTSRALVCSSVSIGGVPVERCNLSGNPVLVTGPAGMPVGCNSDGVGDLCIRMEMWAQGL
jgi:hypothetical protein